MLVTLLIPVTAILLGTLVLGEPLSAREIAGALVIGSALLVIDGGRCSWLRRRAFATGLTARPGCANVIPLLYPCAALPLTCARSQE